jgi:hypothetical protein
VAKYRRRIARLSIDTWLAILSIILAFALAIFAIERFPLWSYFALIIPTLGVMGVLLRISRGESDALYQARVSAIRDRSVQLGFDIFAFLDDRNRHRRAQSVTYDEETVREYHRRFGPQLLQLAKDAEDMGVPHDDLQLLYERQRSPHDMDTAAGYLKSLANKVERLISDNR